MMEGFRGQTQAGCNLQRTTDLSSRVMKTRVIEMERAQSLFVLDQCMRHLGFGLGGEEMLTRGIIGLQNCD